MALSFEINDLQDSNNPGELINGVKSDEENETLKFSFYGLSFVTQDIDGNIYQWQAKAPFIQIRSSILIIALKSFLWNYWS